MSAPLADDNRHVLPRWRDLRNTLASGELRPALSTDPVRSPARDELSERISDWRQEPSVGVAADAIGAAIVLGRSAEALEPAQFIVDHEGDAAPASVELARRIISGPTVTATTKVTEAAIRETLRGLKHGVSVDPRNAFGWAELARNYALVGQLERSLSAMGIALALAPNHRYIVRSAARLYTHIGEPDRAHTIISRAESTFDDPWLLAAELATAELAGKRPGLIRRARALSESGNIHPFDKTELASELATIEAQAGGLCRARKLFRVALEKPNDNAVAQARWAATHKIFELDPNILYLERAYEARAWYTFYSGQWDLSLAAGKRWLSDQPFSASPAVHSSYVASLAIEDYASAIRLSRRGLRANPGNANLLNNLAYSLACAGSTSEASAILAKIHQDNLPNAQRSVIGATAGLIHFRSGDPAQGRQLYELALRWASEHGDRRLAAKVALFLAYEEIRANTPVAAAASASGLMLSSEFKNADFDMLRERLQRAKRAR